MLTCQNNVPCSGILLLNVNAYQEETEVIIIDHIFFKARF